VDFDGLLVTNSGRLGRVNWDSDFHPIEANVAIIRKLDEQGSQIVVTTARPVRYKERLQNFFKSHGITVYDFIFGLNHTERVLINDYSDSNPYPSASALNLMRNTSLEVFSDVL
jgi:hypothetical protein